MKFLVTKTIIVYDKDVKDTLNNEFETNDLQADRIKLMERYQCKEVHFSFIDQELDLFSVKLLYAKVDKIIAKEFETSPATMKSKSRKREVSDARNLAMWWHCLNGSGSLQTIGTFYGNADHTTVLAAKKKINNLIETSAQFREKVEAITAEIELLKR
jgi:chromosomal replication initiation ATPase DnaA